MKTIKVYSFFSGIGFLDLGFENAGIDIDFVNEFNKSFLAGYKYAREKMHVKPPKYGYYCGDINNLLRAKDKKELYSHINDNRENEIIGFIGGPPCPDFSIAGKNSGIKGQNGRLTTSYKRMILLYEPDFFVFENVKGLWSTKKHKEEYEKIKRSFSRKGYVLTEQLLNALEYGVPQERERIILFGIKYNLLSEQKKEARKILKKQFTWNGLQDLSLETIRNCDWPTTDEFILNGNLEKPNNIIEELTVEYWFNKNNTSSHYNSDDYFLPKSKTRFETIPEGDVSRKSFKRLHRWRYSPTAAYGNNEVHLHPYIARRISVAEALAIQSLPSTFVLPKTMSKSEMFKAIGNGVPYLMSKQLAESIKEFIVKTVIKEEK